MGTAEPVVERGAQGLSMRYRIASRTRPGVWHEVLLDEIGLSYCTCEAGRHRRPCWAIKLAKRLEAECDG